MTKVIRIIGIVVGAIMAIGAVFGALNTMFATVATRAREIATLRALGFRSVPVVVAVMLETMLLALLGGVLGGALAWIVFNGYTARSEEHTSELQSLMRISYAVFCLKKK